MIIDIQYWNQVTKQYHVSQQCRQHHETVNLFLFRDLFSPPPPEKSITMQLLRTHTHTHRYSFFSVFAVIIYPSVAHVGMRMISAEYPPLEAVQTRWGPEEEHDRRKVLAGS